VPALLRRACHRTTARAVTIVSEGRRVLRRVFRSLSDHAALSRRADPRSRERHERRRWIRYWTGLADAGLIELGRGRTIVKDFAALAARLG